MWAVRGDLEEQAHRFFKGRRLARNGRKAHRLRGDVPKGESVGENARGEAGAGALQPLPDLQTAGLRSLLSHLQRSGYVLRLCRASEGARGAS